MRYLRILLLASILAASVAGPALGAPATSFQVEVLIYSGRPDPTFAVNDSATVAEINALFTALPPHPTLSGSDSPRLPVLGYRGLHVTPSGMTEVASFDVYGNTIEVQGANGTKTYRFDANATLERRLFELGRAAGAIPSDATSGGAVAAGTQVVARSITINLGPILYTFVPSPARPPVTIVTGTTVRLVATQASESAVVRWVKDSQQVATGTRVFEFTASSPSDSGRYWAIIGPEGGPSSNTDNVQLQVTQREGQRLLNLSVLGRVSSDQPTLIAGFVTEPAAKGTSLLVLIRAIGPALAPFGVADPLNLPTLKVTDARGLEIAPANEAFVLPDVATASGRVGAFPLPATSSDIARLYYLPAGAFTAITGSANGKSGTVLLEIYEVPLH